MVIKEVLEYGVRLRFSAEIYGSKREKTLFHEYLQEACVAVTEISKSLRIIIMIIIIIISSCAPGLSAPVSGAAPAASLAGALIHIYIYMYICIYIYIERERDGERERERERNTYR